MLTLKASHLPRSFTGLGCASSNNDHVGFALKNKKIKTELCFALIEHF
jgi:hypothetical protein